MLRPGQSKLHYLFIIKSHLQSYPCPININCFWNAGFLLVISIVLQLITGILLALHYTPDINYSYYSIIREVYYGWSLRYIHSNGASFLFTVLFIHIGRGLYYGSYYYNPNTWFSGIIIFILLMVTAFMGYVFEDWPNIQDYTVLLSFGTSKISSPMCDCYFGKEVITASATAGIN